VLVGVKMIFFAIFGCGAHFKGELQRND